MSTSHSSSLDNGNPMCAGPPRCRPTPAVVLPVIGGVALGGVALGGVVLWTFKEQVVSGALSFILGTKCRLKTIEVRPRKGLIGIKNIQLWDPEGRPALKVPEVSVQLGRGHGSNDGQGFLSITATNPEVELVFDNYILTQSNWSMIVDKVRGSGKATLSATDKSMIGVVEQERQRRRVDRRKTTSQLEKSSQGMTLTFNIDGGIFMSVRSAPLHGKRLMDDVRMVGVSLDWDDVSSTERLASTVEGLAAYALNTTRGNLHGPRDMRKFAQRYARAILKEETKDARLESKIRLKRLRERIGFFDEWLLKDIPQLKSYSEIAEKTSAALKFMEDLLHSWDSENEEPKGKNDSENLGVGDVRKEARGREKRSSAEPKRENPSESPYRELREEQVKP